jgi:hypothetical protein
MFSTRLVFAVCSLVALSAVARAADEAPPNYRVTLDVTDSIHQLASEDGNAYDAAVQRLAALGPAALPVLAEALHREPDPVRIGLVEVLDQIGEPECAPLLIEAAADKSAQVRIDALVALGSLADERGRPPVEAALGDLSAEVRRAAAAACSTLCRGEAALHRLVEIAVREQPIDAMLTPRHALTVIAQDQDAERAKAAKKAIDDVARPAFAAAAGQEKTRAALLLADLHDGAAVAWLAASVAAENDPKLRVQVITTLGTAGDEGVLPSLVAQSHEPATQAVACRALELLDQRKVNGATAAAAACRAAMPARKR